MTDIIIVITAFTIAMIIIFGIIWYVERSVNIKNEKERFNGGRCPRCSNELKYFYTTLEGRKGYYCDNCEYHTWIKYRKIDRNYRNKNQ